MASISGGLPGPMPGGGVAKRPFHFFFLVDCSGSMTPHGKIQALNAAVEEMLPHLESVSHDNVHSEILVRAISFSDGYAWHVRQPTPPGELRWPPLRARGMTDLGAALTALAAELHTPPMPPRAFPPAVVLVSDGKPTDDHEAGLATLAATEWGSKSQRFAIAIGADADRGMLAQFVGDPDVPVLEARSADHLKHLLQFVSSVAMQRSLPSDGKSQLPPPPVAVEAGDGWV
jgi:uncharacterized protein YegL